MITRLNLYLWIYESNFSMFIQTKIRTDTSACTHTYADTPTHHTDAKADTAYVYTDKRCLSKISHILLEPLNISHRELKNTFLEGVFINVTVAYTKMFICLWQKFSIAPIFVLWIYLTFCTMEVFQLTQHISHGNHIMSTHRP